MSRKNFKNLENPAEMYLSGVSPVNEPPTTAQIVEPKSEEPEEQVRKDEAPKGFRVNPAFIEKRSKRFQMLMPPSLIDAVKQRAKEQGTSANSLIINLLEKELFGDKK